MLQFPSRPARAEHTDEETWKWAGSRCNGSVVHAVPSHPPPRRRLPARCCYPARPRSATRSPPTPTSRSASSCPIRPAAAPTSSRASCRAASSRTLGQPIIIDNRGGAGGSLGTDLVAKAAPDGYTVLFTLSSHTINPAIYPKLAVRHREGLRAGGHGRVAAADPGRQSAVPGEHRGRADRAGQGEARRFVRTHRSATARRGIWPASCSSCAPAPRSRTCPYRGGGPAVTDVIGGQVPLLWVSIPAAAQFVKTGKLKALAVSTAEAQRRLPRRADGAGSRRRRLRGRFLVRDVRAGEDAQADHREAERGAQQPWCSEPDIQEKLLAQGSEGVGGTPEALGTESVDGRSWTDAAWVKLRPADAEHQAAE